jgi:hypothetical protein
VSASDGVPSSEAVSPVVTAPGPAPVGAPLTVDTVMAMQAAGAPNSAIARRVEGAERWSYGLLVARSQELEQAMLDEEAGLFGDEPPTGPWTALLVEVAGWPEIQARHRAGDEPTRAEVDALRGRQERHRRIVAEYTAARQARQAREWAETAAALRALRADILTAQADTREIIRMAFLNGANPWDFIDRSPDEAAATIGAANAKAASNDFRTGFFMDVLGLLAGLGAAASSALGTNGPARVALEWVLPPAAALADLWITWDHQTPATYGSGFAPLTDVTNGLEISTATVDIAGVVSQTAGATLGPLSLLITVYIAPMTKAITTLCRKLQPELIRRNDDMIALDGEPLYPGAEPGGPAMFPYLVDVVSAASADTIPAPPDEVLSYFAANRKRFTSVIPSRPLGGASLDPDGFRRWLFDNRETVWVLLNGSRSPHRHGAR